MALALEGEQLKMKPGIKQRKARNVWAVPFHKDSPKNRLLLETVGEENPFAATFGGVKSAWERVANKINASDLFEKDNARCDHHSCQHQMKQILNYWRGRKASLVPEQYTEWDHILEQALDVNYQNTDSKLGKDALTLEVGETRFEAPHPPKKQKVNNTQLVVDGVTEETKEWFIKIEEKVDFVTEMMKEIKDSVDTIQRHIVLMSGE